MDNRPANVPPPITQITGVPEIDTPAGITAAINLRRDAALLQSGIEALCARLCILTKEPSELSIRKVEWYNYYGFRNVTDDWVPPPAVRSLDLKRGCPDPTDGWRAPTHRARRDLGPARPTITSETEEEQDMMEEHELEQCIRFMQERRTMGYRNEPSQDGDYIRAHVSATSLPNLGVEVWSTQPPWSEVFVAVGAAFGKASISPRHSGRTHVSNDQNYGRFGTVFRVTNVRTKPKAIYTLTAARP
ncbi:hypothetical protein N0V85_004192 [Neurospora sp. IMI 360204]|nr:hypothetical protein N0V85_004192 [Neurospora sp. IMI 360204]